MAHILTNASHMQVGVAVLHEKASQESNHGVPQLKTKIYTGRRGRPRYEISQPFLEDALQLRKIPGIARFLGVSDKTIERRVEEYSIQHPQKNAPVPFPVVRALIEFLLISRPGHGSKMLRSIIRTTYGLTISRRRIQMAIRIIDPTRSLFKNIPIQRRSYQVPGPNALWHHDGQHGMQILSYSYIDLN